LQSLSHYRLIVASFCLCFDRISKVAMSGYPQLGGNTTGNGVPSNVEYQNMDSGNALMGGYKRKQCGLYGVLMLIGAVSSFIGGVVKLVLAYNSDDDDEAHAFSGYSDISNAITFGLIALAALYIIVEDRGDHLVVAWGPCRCFMCGAGKEKIPYSDINSYQVTKTCWFGAGLFGAVKLFNTCSCCCGDMASLCGQTTVQLSIKERPQGLGADDEENMCLENCCIRCCCGERGYYCGKGCCFQPCVNPCNANCCAVNTLYISTNDPNGLMQLLDQKVGRNSEQLGSEGVAMI